MKQGKEVSKLLPILFLQEWMTPMNGDCIILNATVLLTINWQMDMGFESYSNLLPLLKRIIIGLKKGKRNVAWNEKFQA